MHTSILKYVENISQDIGLVNKLIVSLFIKQNKIIVQNNRFILNLIIDARNSIEYDYFVNLQNIYEKKSDAPFTFEHLIELFEFVVSPSDKVVNGAVYTPANIREFIIRKSFECNINIHNQAIIGDIACGCGGFLFNSAITLKRVLNTSYYDIFKNILYGLDIQDYSIERTKILLTLLALADGEDKKNFHFNLYVGNALNFNWLKITRIKKKGGFDLILGNPPYVCSRNIDQVSRKYLKKWEVNTTGHPDLYISFFEVGLNIIKKGGLLSYITVNTFFKSLNGRALREYFQKYKYGISIIDFGGEQIFKAKTTYTCICFIKKNESEAIRYLKSSVLSLNISELEYNDISYSNLETAGWNLNSKVGREFINIIENCGKPLHLLFKIRTGIATLKNNIYKFNPDAEDGNSYILYRDGNEFLIEKNICKDIINSNRITKNNNINELYEKIIFPYIHQNGKINVMKIQYIKKNYPNTYKYLLYYKNELAKRDKGNGMYSKWYAYGRNQSLDKYKYKLLFPHICSKPLFYFNSDPELLFYNGLGIVHQNEKEIRIIQKILESKIFWLYIKNTSRPYSSDYYSLSKNYIKNFGVAELTESEKNFLFSSNNKEANDEFLFKKYKIPEDLDI